MTTYQIWSGMETIGGNIVEVKSERARIICDFGLAVSREAPEKPEEMGELEYLLYSKQLPSIPEIFETEDFKKVVLNSVTQATHETAFFISHLHLDHMGGLKQLPAEARVYLSQESYDLFHALTKVEEEEEVSCTLIPISYDESVTVEDMTVTAKETDHDTIGACAFFIEAPDLKIIHSGDVRLDGPYLERVMKWVNEAKEWCPDVLLLEGTIFSFDQEETTVVDEEGNTSLTEDTLIREAEEWMKTEECIIWNPYIRNVDRLVRMNEAANKQGRTLVFEEPYARVVSIFYPDQTFTSLAETAHSDDFKTVTLEEIAQDPSSYILQNSYKHLEKLKRLSSGVYLHSNGEPLGDYDPTFALMLEKVEEAGFTFYSFGASGHAKKEDLIQIAQQIKAKQTIPWHTFQPEFYAKILEKNGVNTFLPQYDKVYTVREETKN